MANRNDSLAAEGLKNGPRSDAAHTLGEQSARVVADVRELGNIALSGAGDALQSVKERGNELLEQGREKYDDAKDGFERYVSDNPFKSVLIAAGVGVLIGYALRSRR